MSLGNTIVMLLLSSSDKPRARGDVAVSPEDLLVSRSASAKARPRPVRSTAAAVDNAEALRSLKEEKNKVAGTEVEGATFSSKKKVGRKRKAEAESPVQPSASKDIKMKTYQGPVTKPTRDVGYEIIKTPTSFTKITSDAAAAKDLKKSREEECEIVIEDEVKKEKEAAPVKVMDTDRYMCPYEDCQSESKNAQSIKIHLALVHYKKTIQAEFPNWKKQKCEECDRSIGQMTAYYLHMANHKKYKYMDLSPDQLRVPAARKPPGKEMEPPISHPTNHEGKGSSFSEQGKTVSSPFGSANKVLKTNSKSFSPIVTPITKTGNYVKTGPMYKTSSSPGFTQVRLKSVDVEANSLNTLSIQVSRSSGFSSSPGYQVVRTTPTASKVTPKSYTATVTAAAKGPPGPGQIIRIPGPGAEVKPEPGAMRRMSDGFSGGSPGTDSNITDTAVLRSLVFYITFIIAGLMQRGYSRTANVSDKDKDSSKASNKDNFKKQRGF